MHTFLELASSFDQHFRKRHFPEEPQNLYDAAQYILQIGGKRIRPVSVLMGNELFSEIHADSYEIASAVELFHNFSLIHDDIMDKAPLRRGMETVHMKFGEPTALLAGDVMLVVAYEKIINTKSAKVSQLLTLFSDTAKAVCEGQQMDMDFEKIPEVTLDDYVNMITLKTSVLLAASLKMGSIIGDASETDQDHIYEFGKNLGIAFQIQDDYLDAFGDPLKFGKQPGGDILANKKTFLMIHALEVADATQRSALHNLTNGNATDKVEKVLSIFKTCNVDGWAESLKDKYYNQALIHLEAINTMKDRKNELRNLAHYLMNRES